METAGPTLKLGPGTSVTIRGSQPELLEVEGAYEPGGAPPPKHFHPEQDEVFEVLSGTLRARVDDDERTLRAGDTIEIPRGAVHQFWNDGTEPARVIWQTRPAGRTLSWFETLDALQRGEGDGSGLLEEYADVFRLAR